MRDLKTAISEAIKNSWLGDESEPIDSEREKIAEMTEAVWGAIGNQIGLTQEKLMRDLEQTRAERDAGRRREVALAEEVARLRTATASEDQPG